MASTPVERAAPRREGLEDQQERHSLEPGGGYLGRPELRLADAQGVDQPDHDDGEQPHDEHHGRQQEGPGGLAQAAQVEHGDEGEDGQAQRHGGPAEARVRGLERRHPGGDGDGDRERVVDHQGGRGEQAHVGAEVGPGHRIGPATHGVGVDHLPVGEDQDGEQGDDGDGDGQHQVQRARPGDGQDENDRLGPVGHRGERVQREGGEALYGRDPVLPGAPCRPGRTDEQLPDERGPSGGVLCHGGGLYERVGSAIGHARGIARR